MANNHKLTIAVVGAGMGGLTTALAFAKKGFCSIDIYERAPDLRDRYGNPHSVGHWASLAGAMYKACLREDVVQFQFGHTVMSIEGFGTGEEPLRFNVRLRQHTVATADARDKDKVKDKDITTTSNSESATFTTIAHILLAADSIKSSTRATLLSVLNHTVSEADTGQATHRIMLPRSAFLGHAEDLLPILDSNIVVRWIAPRRHIIAYPVANHTIYNLSTTQPDVKFASAANNTYTTQGSKSAMMHVFGDFCPLVKKMLDLVPDGQECEWKPRAHLPLPA